MTVKRSHAGAPDYRRRRYINPGAVAKRAAAMARFLAGEKRKPANKAHLPRCSGKTKSGKPCGNPALDGGSVCYTHKAGAR